MKPGDKVYCIKSHSKMTYIKGNVYEIHKIKTCMCGKLCLNLVGVVTRPGKQGTKCSDCTSTICYIEQYCNSRNFVPLDHWKQAEYMVEELKEELEVTV